MTTNHGVRVIPAQAGMTGWAGLIALWYNASTRSASQEKATPCKCTEWPRFREETRAEARELKRRCERGPRTSASTFDIGQPAALFKGVDAGQRFSDPNPRFELSLNLWLWHFALLNLASKNFPHHTEREKMRMNQR